MKRVTFASALALALTAWPAQAATTITFDDLAAMANNAGSFVPTTARLSDFYLATHGVSFSSGAGYVAVVDHIAGCGAPCTPTPPNIIGGTAPGDLLNYAIPITATFFLPSSTSTEAVTDFVSVASDLVPISGTVTLEAYDLNGLLIGSDTELDGQVVSVSVAGIHSVRFFSSNATVGFDNFSIGNLTAVVPEPASWAMMIAGFGLVGAGMRRRPVPVIA